MPDHITPSAASQLHTCPTCASPHVDLVDGTEAVPGHWELTLRCPECERFREVACTEPDLARLEEALARGAAALAEELERVSRLAFEEDVERLIVALRANAILPMDLGLAQ
jgi:hypothetical protein